MRLHARPGPAAAANAALDLIQAWLASGPLTDSRLVLLTRGAAATGDNDDTDPAAAAIWGLAASAQSETPGHITLIDLDDDPASAAALPVVIAAAHPQAAVRAGQVLLPRLVPAPRDTEPATGDTTDPALAWRDFVLASPAVAPAPSAPSPPATRADQGAAALLLAAAAAGLPPLAPRRPRRRRCPGGNDGHHHRLRHRQPSPALGALLATIPGDTPLNTAVLPHRRNPCRRNHSLPHPGSPGRGNAAQGRSRLEPAPGHRRDASRTVRAVLLGGRRSRRPRAGQLRRCQHLPRRPRRPPPRPRTASPPASPGATTQATGMTDSRAPSTRPATPAGIARSGRQAYLLKRRRRQRLACCCLLVSEPGQRPGELPPGETLRAGRPGLHPVRLGCSTCRQAPPRKNPLRRLGRAPAGRTPAAAP